MKKINKITNIILIFVVTGACGFGYALPYPSALRPPLQGSNLIEEAAFDAFLRDVDEAEVIVFDWDGPISDIRAGWEGIMVPAVAATVQGIVIDEKRWDMLLESVLKEERLNDYRTTKAIATLIEEGILDNSAVEYARDMIEETKGEPTPLQFERALQKSIEAYNDRNRSHTNDYHDIFMDTYKGNLDPLNNGFAIDFKKPSTYFAKFYVDVKLEIVRNKRLEMIQKGEKTVEDFMAQGSPELLQYMRARRKKCHVLTGSTKKSVDQEVDIFGLRDIFSKDRVSGFDFENNLRGKEEVLMDIAERENVKGKKLLVVGDGKVEIMVGVKNGFLTAAMKTKDNKIKPKSYPGRWVRAHENKNNRSPGCCQGKSSTRLCFTIALRVHLKKYVILSMMGNTIMSSCQPWQVLRKASADSSGYGVCSSQLGPFGTESVSPCATVYGSFFIL